MLNPLDSATCISRDKQTMRIQNELLELRDKAQAYSKRLRALEDLYRDTGLDYFRHVKSSFDEMARPRLPWLHRVLHEAFIPFPSKNYIHVDSHDWNFHFPTFELQVRELINEAWKKTFAWDTLEELRAAHKEATQALKEAEDECNRMRQFIAFLDGKIWAMIDEARARGDDCDFIIYRREYMLGSLQARMHLLNDLHSSQQWTEFKAWVDTWPEAQKWTSLGFPTNKWAEQLFFDVTEGPGATGEDFNAGLWVPATESEYSTE